MTIENPPDLQAVETTLPPPQHSVPHIGATPLPNKHHSTVLQSDPAGPPSSSPAFATPLPLLPPRAGASKAGAVANRIAALARNGSNGALTTPSVISVRIDPPALRMLAVRVFKRHGLNIAGAQTLPALASFVGVHCGARWKDDGLAEGVLDEVARLWKAQRPRDPLVREENGILASVLKVIAGIMVGGRVRKGASLSRQGSFVDGERGPGVLSRQASFGIGGLALDGENEVEEDEKELLKDPREWIRVVDAFEQPRLIFNTGKRHFER
jgi:DNA polymerase epsilon subunit 2